MRYFRCKCGETTAFGSMSPDRCYGCPKCGMTLASHPDNHRTPEPHDFTGSIRQMSEVGPVDVPVCRYCHRTRWEIEHPGDSAAREEPSDEDIDNAAGNGVLAAMVDGVDLYREPAAPGGDVEALKALRALMFDVFEVGHRDRNVVLGSGWASRRVAFDERLLAALRSRTADREPERFCPMGDPPDAIWKSDASTKDVEPDIRSSYRCADHAEGGYPLGCEVCSKPASYVVVASVSEEGE